MTQDFFEEEYEASPRMKLAVIAGASEALNLKRDWKKSDSDILQEITKKVDEIIKKID